MHVILEREKFAEVARDTNSAWGGTDRRPGAVVEAAVTPSSRLNSSTSDGSGGSPSPSSSPCASRLAPTCTPTAVLPFDLPNSVQKHQCWTYKQTCPVQQDSDNLCNRLLAVPNVRAAQPATAPSTRTAAFWMSSALLCNRAR